MVFALAMPQIRKTRAWLLVFAFCMSGSEVTSLAQLTHWLRRQGTVAALVKECFQLDFLGFA
jgi:hypothetical protein